LNGRYIIYVFLKNVK